MNKKLNFVAQGTTEYLIIVAIIIVMGLIVVTLLLNFFSNTNGENGITHNESDLYWKKQSISLEGGIIGEILSGTQLSKSFFDGNVFGSNYVGGVAGYAKYGSFDNLYALGNINSEYTNAGGLLGYEKYVNNITNSFAAISNVGDCFIGYSQSGTTSLNNYCDTTVSEDTNPNYATAKTTSEMMNQSTFTNWDFDTIWDINEGTSYPFYK